MEKVKERLPGHTGTQDDTELTSCVTAVDAIIDNVLKNYVSTPLSSPPQIIKDISADLAAGIFRERRAPADEKIVLKENALLNLEKYVKEAYLEAYSSSSKRFRKVDRLDSES